MAHGAIARGTQGAESRAATPPEAVGDMRERLWTAGSKGLPARIAIKVCNSGSLREHLSSSQRGQCGLHRRDLQYRNEKRAKARDMAWLQHNHQRRARGTVAHCNSPKRHTGKNNNAVDGARPATNRCRGARHRQLASWACGARFFGIAAQCASTGRVVARCKCGAKDAESGRCGMARGENTSREQVLHNTLCDTLGEGAWRGNKAFPAKDQTHKLQTWPRAMVICGNRDTAQRCAPHRCKTRGQSETRDVDKRCERAALSATPRATGEKDVGRRRAAGQALPAEHRDNGLRLGRATCASLDIAARRINAGHNIASCDTGARRTQNARCAMTPPRGDSRHARALLAQGNTPTQTQNVGQRRTAGQRGVAGGDARLRLAK